MTNPTLFGPNTRPVQITPEIEKHILVIEDFLSNDRISTNKVDQAADTLIALGADISNPRTPFYQPPPLSKEKFISVKFHYGRVARLLEGLSFEELSTEDQCDVLFDTNEIANLCGFTTTLENLKANKFRSRSGIVVVRSTFNRLKEYMFETNDTAGALTRELRATYHEIVDSYNHLYGTRRHINRSPEVDMIFDDIMYGVEQPQRGYMNAMDKMRIVFLEDSLLLSLSRTIYRSVETLSVSGRGSSEQMVKNIKDLQYNFLSTMSDKSRVTTDGQEHVLGAVGVMDVKVSLANSTFDVDYDITKMIPYRPKFEDYLDVLHKAYDINIMALEDKVTHTLDSYNDIMMALDKMALSRENLDIILGVVDTQLDLDTRILSKVVEQTLKQIKYIANIFEEAVEKVQDNHRNIKNETF